MQREVQFVDSPDAGDALLDTAADPAAAGAARGTILGTVIDFYGNVVPGATVVLARTGSNESRQAIANDNGAFLFEGLDARTSYRIVVRAQGYADWRSQDIVVAPGQSVIVSQIAMKLMGDSVSVTVRGDSVQIATEQVELAEHQRVLGFIPNFYVVYDSANAVPLTTKLKFQLALRVARDPVTAVGVAFLSGVDQAADTPNFQQGARGYGQRFGTVAADGLSDILIGGAILPSLLHQDPRYFYQGTGSIKSRFRHAALSPLICRGDNGKSQFNASSLGGDLFSSALSNAYYPQSNRGASLVFSNFAVGTAERVVSAVAQEFIIRKLSSVGRKKGE